MFFWTLPYRSKVSSVLGRFRGAFHRNCVQSGNICTNTDYSFLYSVKYSKYSLENVVYDIDSTEKKYSTATLSHRRPTSEQFYNQPRSILSFDRNLLVDMATRRPRQLNRVEPYRTCHVGPRKTSVHPAAATAVAKSNNLETRNMSTGGGMTFMKKFGQHMLKNPGILDKIVQAAEIRPSDTVLEIGPGTGNLTVRLVPLARKVIAIDIDSRMVGEVKKRCIQLGYNNLEVLEGDALRMKFPKFDVCTANLPYQISSPFVFKLLSHRPLFRCAVLMFQREFAERLLANTNEEKYGRLAINTRLFCEVTRVCKVAAGSFNPPPKVESMIVKIVPRDQPLVVDFGEWDGLIRVCFSRKRRTLRSLFKNQAVLSILECNYKAWCTINKQIPEDIPFKDLCMNVLTESGLSDRRSITVSIAEFLKLLLAFNEAGIHFCNIAKPTHSGDKSGEPLSRPDMPSFLFEEDVEMDD
ncbi:dimethyladenosine transferase, putative [Theileria equi strain WA]|uniref:rRNA adenine N(6)-methyltransferase n=1 Tax=Theileria equi strain WA TaxID=1537102 RepID=L0B0U0_THEEQ|nr:dimethyladenosine transferase, putative [Theileria equi strain WA]AFZ81420.1 dimethyladenosine transferase, putative [Theileria equi strain WA]|eukprot:XP_004831086.1 dimethyladenosine transferase, putative [Theileria equi strain WA]